MELKFIAYHPHPEFALYENNKMVAESKLDTEANAFRIKCFNTRRVFLIYEEVIKNRPVTTLVNEYNVPLASITDTSFGNNSGTIEMEGLFYKYRVNGMNEIHIYNAGSSSSLLACTLQVDEKLLSMDNYMNFILFSLVWFMYSSKEAKVSMQLV
ncbi:MAG TPA: hypothetical protein VG847_00470 [Chitinophagaceae bacterium]|nr:hypothetical protein [Chitinophagaceae bacterium]